jgi:hypothetical protein
MAIIPVPRPSKKAWNPDRTVNALLLAQVEHLQHAERRLPLRYRSETYTRAIRTEGEAARYIRDVTEAVHHAHATAQAERAKRARGAKGRSKTKEKGRKGKRGKKRRLS